MAVAGERSFGLIASMTAVLASGGVLLPIDRSLPIDRQRRMLAQARVGHALWVGDERCLTRGERRSPRSRSSGSRQRRGALTEPSTTELRREESFLYSIRTGRRTWSLRRGVRGLPRGSWDATRA